MWTDVKDRIFEGKIFQSEGALNINALCPIAFLTIGVRKEV